jgi:hypothetical protein
MTCAACGAPLERSLTCCAVCGYGQGTGSDDTWDRQAEAYAYEDLGHALKPDEGLLAVTRGRVTGTISKRTALDPQVLLSPYANIGLTGERILVQHIKPRTGRAISRKPSAIDIQDVADVGLTDADPVFAGRTARLAITLNSGESVRVRATGRLARGARGFVEVWGALSGKDHAGAPASPGCPHCGRTMDRAYRFCPFCGKEIGED